MAELSHEDMAVNFLHRRIEEIAGKLRRMAEAVDREASRVAGGPSSYSGCVHDVQHAVLWGLANLSLDALVTAAADADQGRIEDKKRAVVPDA